jgi:UDP-glucose:(heptosyl)LPS alpha-1,3-glucosyltransferase
MTDVLIVTDRWDAQGGGRERYAAEISHSLAAHGHAVHIACREIRAAGSISASSPIRFIGGGARRTDDAVQRSVTSFRRDHQDAPVLALRPVLGATHYQLHSGILQRSFEAERDSINSTLRQRLFWPALRFNRHRRTLLDTEARLLSSPDEPSLMAFSQGVRQDLVSHFGVQPDRVVVSRLGIDPSIFRPSPSADAADSVPIAPTRLVFAGHNFALKGLGALIRAVGQLAGAGMDVRLTVAGSDRTGPFEQIADTCGAGSRILFAGNLTQPELARLFQGSHSLVHPTFYDPFPRVILEALACGCQVVTTRRCGGAEIVREGINGELIGNPRDVEAIAEAIKKIAKPERHVITRRLAASLGAAFSFEAHASETMRWLGLPAEACVQPIPDAHAV